MGWRCFLRGISIMASRLRLSSLIPAGLIVERTAEEEGVLLVSARAAADERACPLCGRASRRVHSHKKWVSSVDACFAARRTF
jgi:hypothetical protein